MQATFALAKRADLDTVLGFMREYCEYDGLEFEEEIARRALGELLRDDSLGRVFLIRDGLEPVGYVALSFGFSLEFDGRDAFVDELCIRESYRGRGYGTAALKFLEETCRARRLYEAAGFDAHERYLMTRWIEPA